MGELEFSSSGSSRRWQEKQCLDNNHRHNSAYSMNKSLNTVFLISHVLSKRGREQLYPYLEEFLGRIKGERRTTVS